VYWYFFLEIFDHFRGFYLCVFHLHMAAYLPPLAIRLRDTPTLLYTVLGILIAAFKTYPSFADAALAHALLPLWAPLYACVSPCGPHPIPFHVALPFAPRA
jgi:phosphatidylinositol glycan class U